MRALTADDFICHPGTSDEDLRSHGKGVTDGAAFRCHWWMQMYKVVSTQFLQQAKHTSHHAVTRVWANAQRDGRPAEYRWRPLFNATKFGWRLLLECRAVTLPRRETRWNLHGCPKLSKQSQPLVGRSSPYYGDMWRKYCCLPSFIPIVDICVRCEDTAQQSGAMVPIWRFFCVIFASCISSGRVQHISDLHPKFALRPHHV